MRIIYNFGSLLYDFGNSNFIFVDLHPTSSLRTLPREDVGADLLSVHLAREFKSKAIITMLPRDHEFGMDLNRLPPPENLALKMFEPFLKLEKNKTVEFEKKYAWVASSKDEHLKKEEIYKRFWLTLDKISDSNSIFIFIHAQSLGLKNFPSLVDVVPLKGFKENKIESVIRLLNKKWEKQFTKLKKDFLECLIFHTKHIWKSFVQQTMGSLDPKTYKGSIREHYEKMLNRIRELGFKKEYEILRDTYSLENHVEVIKKIVPKVPLQITLMKNFSGKFALASKKFLKNKKWGIEFEVNTFLSEIYPNLGRDILKELIEEITST